MLVPFLRSSLLGNWELCQTQCILTYGLGMENRAGAAASMGSCVHKMMELRALASIAKKNGHSSFNYEDWGVLEVDWAIDLDQTIEKCHANQLILDNHVNPEKIIKSKILDWAKRAIEDYPQYDPINLNIMSVEQYFDLEIKEDWAKYSQEINGELYEGYLRIKGTIDCLIAHNDDIIEVFDFKSGSRKNFATGEIKTLEYLRKDKQLLFYLYALNKLFPNKNFIMTLYFINDGGIYSVHGDDEMLEDASEMIKKTYKEILNTKLPSVLDPKRSDFRCRHCCKYSKTDSYTRGLSVCEFMQNKFKTIGVDKTVEKYGNIKSIMSYGSGGGKIKDE